ncbi:DUF937 domain-containing protein [Arthrobacter sp. B3I4]|uniref:DUF937 domain-containing protein n=1 Tax=Arthrobacter sp. B3I4 TaxID=3042267 RepID=UPI00277E27AA|nr:DUF937 domain-containing protein [Arthrobacter sp. B3I4]MDQ0756957.1 hypothetical protein [Arthrobacter sp. B3I4]
MTELQGILGQIPVDQLAGMLGTDRQTAQAAVEAAVPTLLAGLHDNAQAPEGAASLESALGQHDNGLVDGGVDAAQIDTADGEKIVDHVFGGRQDQVASQLAGTAPLGGVSRDLVRRLLPLLAPIVMSYLAKKVLGGSRSGGGAGAGGAGGIDLGGILGGILGGAAGGGGLGGGLGDILGGVLGGGRGANEAVPGSAAPAPDAGPSPELQPQAAPQTQPSGGAPQPGELIDIDLPGQQDEAPQTPQNDARNDGQNNDGGLGGLLGGLFGKK